jgi:hypothetical protein
LRFDFEATGIGSVPFKDPKTACRVIFDNFKEIPFWPQLPKRSFLESMYVQYSEGLPGVVLDEKSQYIHLNIRKAYEELEGVYTKYIEGDVDFFKISKDHAQGFYEFENELRASGRKLKFAKGHITGPVSYALFVTDENKRAIMYDKDIYEVTTKVLAMKARWQIRRLKELAENVIIFIDEPYLVSIGSSYVTMDINDAMAKLDEVIAAIKEEGALAGLHCCGNTDWPLILKRNLDILNFDAYNFTKEFSLYAADINDYLKRGGTIAWGMIPSSDASLKETESSLKEKMLKALDALAAKGIDRKNISSLITPSCGVGSLDEETAKKVFDLARSLSKKIS